MLKCCFWMVIRFPLHKMERERSEVRGDKGKVCLRNGGERGERDRPLGWPKESGNNSQGFNVINLTTV